MRKRNNNTPIPALCIETDHDHIAIPVTRFIELLRAESQRDICQNAYLHLDLFAANNTMEALFGPKPEENPEESDV